MVLLVLIFHLLVFKSDLASGGSRSLQYFYTGVTQGINFPEFTAVGLVDGEQFLYYDSNTSQAIPKVDWIKNNEGPEYWTRNTQNLQGSEAAYKANLITAMQRFNQSGGIHIVQSMYGCELDDETGATDGYRQFGYDGADFISLDLKSTSWVAPVPQAVITKQKWDRAEAEHKKKYLTEKCIYWLKKYVQYGRISLERKVPPQVSLLQTVPSSPVVCHATGFYPDKVKISWQKDGQDLHEDVDVGETLPNHDGTFQKRAELKVTPDVWKKNQFTCVVEHKSGDPIHMILTEKKIRTNSAGNNVPGIVAGLVVAALVLIAVVVVGGVMVVKRRSGYQQASHPDQNVQQGSGEECEPLATPESVPPACSNASGTEHVNLQTDKEQARYSTQAAPETAPPTFTSPTSEKRTEEGASTDTTTTPANQSAPRSGSEATADNICASASSLSVAGSPVHDSCPGPTAL
ncbi:BOLA class I histocompatibility antigen, alpha chain BL3-7-like [Denticeps clupeoides]|uniref:BOLA class I histocompatibility antigen, alpha chain BL3-7-like n=1 Tax=Denticeps clupeoides TaxID=299321 RepID=UPI0010A44251|nr:BOLA class I histocompatibility antigen, alpha chain BL3-7-like [Denticeps clupeoides]